MYKKIYIVRHGQSIANVKDIWQSDAQSLSELGIEQAASVANYAKLLEIQTLLTSPYVRARETSVHVAEALDISMNETDLLRERKSPSEVLGLTRKDPESMRIVGEIDAHYDDLDYRYSDEENFSDLKARAKTLHDMLMAHESDRIMLVTHRDFICFFHAYSIWREELTPENYKRIFRSHSISNGGINHYVISDENKHGHHQPFILKKWGDVRHLDHESYP